MVLIKEKLLPMDGSGVVRMQGMGGAGVWAGWDHATSPPCIREWLLLSFLALKKYLIEYRIIFTHKGSLGIEYPVKGSLDRPVAGSTRGGLTGLEKLAVAVLATNSTAEDRVIQAALFFCLRGVVEDTSLAIELVVLYQCLSRCAKV